MKLRSLVSQPAMSRPLTMLKSGCWRWAGCLGSVGGISTSLYVWSQEPLTTRLFDDVSIGIAVGWLTVPDLGLLLNAE